MSGDPTGPGRHRLRPPASRTKAALAAGLAIACATLSVGSQLSDPGSTNARFSDEVVTPSTTVGWRPADPLRPGRQGETDGAELVSGTYGGLDSTGTGTGTGSGTGAGGADGGRAGGTGTGAGVPGGSGVVPGPSDPGGTDPGTPPGQAPPPVRPPTGEQPGKPAPAPGGGISVDVRGTVSATLPGVPPIGRILDGVVGG